MTEEKQNFAERAKAKFLAAFDAKYAKGDAEHNEDFFALDHLREAYDEIIDLFTYVSAGIERRETEYQRGYQDGIHAALHEPSIPESED